MVETGFPTGLNHIGVVVEERSWDGKRPLVIHNIGGGQVIEDILFEHHIVVITAILGINYINTGRSHR